MTNISRSFVDAIFAWSIHMMAIHYVTNIAKSYSSLTSIVVMYLYTFEKINHFIVYFEINSEYLYLLHSHFNYTKTLFIFPEIDVHIFNMRNMFIVIFDFKWKLLFLSY